MTEEPNTELEQNYQAFLANAQDRAQTEQAREDLASGEGQRRGVGRNNLENLILGQTPELAGRLFNLPTETLIRYSLAVEANYLSIAANHISTNPKEIIRKARSDHSEAFEYNYLFIKPTKTGINEFDELTSLHNSAYELYKSIEDIQKNPQDQVRTSAFIERTASNVEKGVENRLKAQGADEKGAKELANLTGQVYRTSSIHEVLRIAQISFQQMAGTLYDKLGDKRADYTEALLNKKADNKDYKQLTQDLYELISRPVS